MKRLLIGTLALVMLGGCTLAPEYVQPNMPMPPAWNTANIGKEDLSVCWWKRFNDPVLNSLVEEALNNSPDIQTALSKVDYARGQMGQARSALMPQVVLDGSSMHNQVAKNGPSYNPGAKRPWYIHNYALGGSWLLDFFGQARSAWTGMSEVLSANEAGYEATLLSISGYTTQAYFTLRSLDQQLAIAERTLATREEAHRIYKDRYEQGLISELDWVRVGTEVETARTMVYSVRMGVDAAESALSALVGRSPRDIMEGKIARGTSLEKLPTAPVLPAGIPSDLLTRRPDIRAAEHAVKASNAQIGYARASYFPSISLTGAFGFESLDMNKLLGKAGSETWSYGLQVSAPVLTWGRVYSENLQAEAQQREQIANYQKVVQTAFRDMRDALTKQRETVNIVKGYQALVSGLRRASELARMRYDNGYSDYLDVLDAERQLFQSEIELANAELDRLNAIVSVCMALGGGWKDEGQPVTPAGTAK